MPMLGVWGHAPRKILKNKSPEIEFEGISRSQSCMLYYLHDQLNAIAIAIVQVQIWNMHADRMLLYLLQLWTMHDRFPQRSKSWAKLLSISLPSSFRDHLGLAKYRSLQTSVTFYQMPSHWPMPAIRMDKVLKWCYDRPASQPLLGILLITSTA